MEKNLEQFKLKKIINELNSHRGRHTEFITVYIPSGYEMSKIIQNLEQERGTATNIKSTSTRQNVIDALEKMIQHLKLITKTPPNGLAAFSGNIAEPGKQNLKIWSIEPPETINQKLYRCDKTFITEPLEELLQTKEVYALIVMDKREGNIAILKGKKIIPILNTTSNVPGKTRAGGQSAQRFERLREGAAKEFFGRLAEHMKDNLLQMKELQGIIIGGPGHTKNEFIEGNHITNELKKKIIAIKDITYTGQFGLEELLNKSKDTLKDAEITKEKEIMQKFLHLLATEEKKTSYGEQQVKEALEKGAVETLLLSESLEPKKIEQYEQTTQQYGTTIKIISTDSREGTQLKELGKIAAILRYAIE